MRLFFLGTGAASPSRQRNVSALALLFDQSSEWWLFDCGEATQHQIIRAPVTLAKLRRIFISHLHGDHCLGLPGLLATRGMQGATEALEIIGPPGLKEYVDATRKATGMHFPYPVLLRELSAEGPAHEDERCVVEAWCVPHGIRTFAWVIAEKDSLGRFKVEDAQTLGIPSGPIYAQLKRGEKVTLPDGRTIDGATLVEPPRKGRKLVLVSDTYDSTCLHARAQNAAAVVHEATFLERTDAQKARDHSHSTAAQAGRFAQTCGAKKLILTHFSSRYEGPQEPGTPGITDLVAEAAAQFTNGPTLAARDLLEVEIERAK